MLAKKKKGLFKAPLISLSTGVDMPHTVCRYVCQLYFFPHQIFRRLSLRF